VSDTSVGWCGVAIRSSGLDTSIHFCSTARSWDWCISVDFYIHPFLKYTNNKKHARMQVKVKVKVWTLAIAPLRPTWVRLVTSSALQSRKWQLIGMSQWCRSALCGHPLPMLTDNWTHGAASRHTITLISHTRHLPRRRSYYLFPVPLRVGS